MIARESNGSTSSSGHTPFRTLGELGVFVRGNGLQKSDLTESGFPAIHYGQLHTHYDVWASTTKSFTTPEFASKLRRARPGDLVIATTSEDDASVGKATAWLGEGEVAVSGDAYIYRHELDPRFVSYFFQSEQFRSQKLPYVTGTKVRRISGDALAKIKIPVPTLAQQVEIVRTLDLFRELEAELEAELDARRLQYAHYSEAILDQAGEVAETRELGSIITFLRTGLNPRQNFTLNPPGAAGYYATVRELDGFGVRFSDKTDRLDETGLKAINGRSRLRAGDVLFSATGTIGRTALVESDPVDWNIKEGVYALTPNSEVVNSRYLIYALRSRTVRDEVLGRSAGSTVQSIPMAELRRVQIQVPTLEVQRSVVDQLDKFDALVNDLSIGLPAELAARRKQYEYYRDKLLTFEEAPA